MSPKKDKTGESAKLSSRRLSRVIAARESIMLPWHEAKIPRSRWMLQVQAVFWRVLMSLGMFFHRLAPPRPPKPNFSRSIPSTISGRSGDIDLHFYVPKNYKNQKSLYNGDHPSRKSTEEMDGGVKRTKSARRISATFSQVGEAIRRRGSIARRWGGYPVVINFHGGGFTLGSAADDARWCGTVVEECQAIVVSVDYRLAPENPFPTAVEDGVDAVLYIHRNAEELGIDTEKIVLSGFSSGANMACSVPLRLYDEIKGFPRAEPEIVSTRDGLPQGHGSREVPGPAEHDKSENLIQSAPIEQGYQPQGKGGHVNIDIQSIKEFPDISIRCIIPWYPSLDYTRSREQRRATCSRKDQELSAIFTDLFDESYLHPPRDISLDSPYLSPGIAPPELLRNALPQHIILNTCEWDMLLDEGVAFKDRLIELGKTVHYTMIEGVPHGWDKAPNPWKPTPGVREHYLRACKQLRQVLSPVAIPEQVVEEEPEVLEEHQTADGPSAAPRDSIAYVR